MAAPKGHAKAGGRQKGTPNKTTKALKDAILEAAELAGGAPTAKEPGGLVSYLRTLADDQPNAFAGLLGRVLPMQVSGDPDNPLRTITEIRETIIDPKRNP